MPCRTRSSARSSRRCSWSCPTRPVAARPRILRPTMPYCRDWSACARAARRTRSRQSRRLSVRSHSIRTMPARTHGWRLRNGQIVASLWDLAAGAGFQSAYDSMQKHLALAMRAPTPLAHAVNAELARSRGPQQRSTGRDRRRIGTRAERSRRARHARAHSQCSRPGQRGGGRGATRAASRAELFTGLPACAGGGAVWTSGNTRRRLRRITEVVNRQSDDPFDFATLIACLWANSGARPASRKQSRKYNSLAVPCRSGSADRPGIQLVVVRRHFQL